MKDSEVLTKALKDLLNMQLPQDIEGSNKLREDIDPLDLCNQKPCTCGVEGSNRRRFIQKRFDHVTVS